MANDAPVNRFITKAALRKCELPLRLRGVSLNNTGSQQSMTQLVSRRVSFRQALCRADAVPGTERELCLLLAEEGGGHCA